MSAPQAYVFGIGGGVAYSCRDCYEATKARDPEEIEDWRALSAGEVPRDELCEGCGLTLLRFDEPCPYCGAEAGEDCNPDCSTWFGEEGGAR